MSKYKWHKKKKSSISIISTPTSHYYRLFESDISGPVVEVNVNGHVVVSSFVDEVTRSFYSLSWNGVLGERDRVRVGNFSMVIGSTGVYRVALQGVELRIDKLG